MLTELVLLFVLGLKTAWAPEYCPTVDMNQERCTARQEEGYALATQLSTWFVEEGERQDLSPFILAAVAFREGSFTTGELCHVVVPVERITRRTDVEARVAGDDREELCITKLDGTEGCWTVLVLEESDTEVKIDRCGAGEQGMMQLVSHETPAGLVIPATGEALPRNARDRRAMVIETHNNISLGALTIHKVRDMCCAADSQTCYDGYTFLQAYNSGHCTTDPDARYNARIAGHLQKGLEYVCEQRPDAWMCGGDNLIGPALAGPPEETPAEVPAP
jgi:hypothetical protein